MAEFFCRKGKLGLKSSHFPQVRPNICSDPHPSPLHPARNNVDTARPKARLLGPWPSSKAGNTCSATGNSWGAGKNTWGGIPVPPRDTAVPPQWRKSRYCHGNTRVCREATHLLYRRSLSRCYGELLGCSLEILIKMSIIRPAAWISDMGDRIMEIRQKKNNSAAQGSDEDIINSAATFWQNGMCLCLFVDVMY